VKRSLGRLTGAVLPIVLGVSAAVVVANAPAAPGKAPVAAPFRSFSFVALDSSSGLRMVSPPGSGGGPAGPHRTSSPGGHGGLPGAHAHPASRHDGRATGHHKARQGGRHTSTPAHHHVGTPGGHRTTPGNHHVGTSGTGSHARPRPNRAHGAPPAPKRRAPGWSRWIHRAVTDLLGARLHL
jgi:hypothetical protein